MRNESFRKQIKEQYRSCNLKQADKLQKNVITKSRVENHIKFLKKCRDENIVPKGLKVHLPEENRCKNVKKMKEKLEMTRIKNKLKENRTKLAKTIQEIERIKHKLKEIFNTEDYKWLEEVIGISFEKEKKKVKERQQKKFKTLMMERDSVKKEHEREQEKDQKEMERKKIKTEVVDLTKDGIDPEVRKYLALGPDFCIAPTKVPYERIICETERMCSDIRKESIDGKIEQREAEDEIMTVREEVKTMLKNTKERYPSNLNREEKAGQKKAFDDKQHVYLPADKGRIMVAMDRFEKDGGTDSYEYKMKAVMEDLKATETIRAGKEWDLTSKVCRDGEEIINKIVKRGELKETEGNRLKPRHCRAPRLTGLPKVHKEGVPMRGVVSTVGSPFDKISRKLIPILRTIQGRSKLYIKNSTELKEKVRHWRVERNERLVSYDVKNLYPSIPIKKALKLIESLLASQPNLRNTTTMSVRSVMELLNWMFRLTYCEFEGKYYVLDSGPIGLGATGEVAIIYMEEFQIRAMKTSPHDINEWYWYVDDSELKCKEGTSQEILDHLNSIEPEHIEFTKEEEEQNELAVLDLKQTVDRRKKKIKFTVNYKKTHTNINVKERSNHPETMKRGIIKGFAERARRLCDEENLDEEMKNIEDIFVANGYNRKTVREYIQEEKREEKEGNKEERETRRGILKIPYLKDISEKFKRIATKHNFQTAFNPGNKIKEIKSRAQIPLGNKKTDTVYRIPCKCKTYSYIGETWRLTETRMSEHRASVKMTEKDIAEGNMESAEARMNKDDGGLAKHNTRCGKGIDWEKTEVITQEKGRRQRLVREGIESIREIRNGNNVLNIYDRIETWQPTLAEMFKRDVEKKQ